MIEVVKKKKFFMKVFYDWIIPIICAVFIAILINKFLIFQIQIPSESMLPTLEIGDRLFANRIYKEESLSRGDLIIFYSDEKKELMIKRLIGLPNDNVVIDNSVDSNKDGDYEVEYQLEDQHGNVAISTLIVHIRTVPQTEDNTAVRNKEDSTVKKNQEQRDKSNKVETPKTINVEPKIFYIKDYNYDLSACSTAF